MERARWNFQPRKIPGSAAFSNLIKYTFQFFFFNQTTSNGSLLKMFCHQLLIFYWCQYALQTYCWWNITINHYIWTIPLTSEQWTQKTDASIAACVVQFLFFWCCLGSTHRLHNKYSGSSHDATISLWYTLLKPRVFGFHLFFAPERIIFGRAA